MLKTSVYYQDPKYFAIMNEISPFVMGSGYANYLNISTRSFNNTLRKKYNATIMEYGIILFENKNDAEKAIEWVNSLITMKLIKGD